MHYLSNIEDVLFLMESGDTSFHIGAVRIHSDDDEFHKKNGITQHKEYDLDHGQGGLLTIWKRDGAYEMHHEIKDDSGNNVSGTIVPHKTDVRKFYGTMKLVGTRILDSGNKLRIVGNHIDGMFQKYNRMANMFAKEGGHSVSSPRPYNVNSEDAKNLSEITIQKESGKYPTSFVRKGVTESRTDFSQTGYETVDESELDKIMYNINQGNK